MQITIFNDLTTSEQLAKLVEEGEKYTGLYVDMSKLDQRKYVKEQAASINELKKKVERKRIDAAKEYKKRVDSEAKEIISLLNKANEPFDLLIDEYKAERQKVLDAEKARKQAILDAEQYQLDHEEAIMLNKIWDLEADARAAKKLKEAQELEALIIEREKAAAEQARLNEVARIQEAERVAKQAEQARLANKEYKAEVNRAALSDLMVKCALTDEQARSVIIAIAKNEISNVTINY